MDKRERKQHLIERMKIEPGDTWSYVVLEGVALGRFKPSGDGWRLDWLSEKGWMAAATELRSDHREHAEGWAVDEVAHMLAATEESRTGGG